MKTKTSLIPAESQFFIETLVFYMHLVDRLAFAYLGAARRQVFCDCFSVAVVKKVLRELTKGVSADDMDETLRDTYSGRQIEYAQYKVLIPTKDEPPNGTLYWEFSKILFGFVDDKNPALLTFLNLLVRDLTEATLDDALKVEKVLQALTVHEYHDPVEQIMFILGFKHDPRFETTLHAISRGANPGIMDALDYARAQVAVSANLCTLAKAVKKIRGEFGAEIPSTHKHEIYQVIVQVLDEEHYGGRWYENTRIPSNDWIDMRTYSPLFVKESEVFYLPAPYFKVLRSIV